MAVSAVQVPTPIALPVFDDSCKLKWVEVQGCRVYPQDVKLLTFLLRKRPSGVVITDGLAFKGDSLHVHVFDFVRCLHADLSGPLSKSMFTAMRWRCKADPQSAFHEGPPLTIGYLSAISAAAAKCCGNASPCCVCLSHKSDIERECWCAWRDEHVPECDGSHLQLGGVESSSVQVPRCAYYFRLFYHALLALRAVGRGLIDEALQEIRFLGAVWDADVQEVYNPQPSEAPSLVAAQPAATARLCDLFYIFRCFVELKSAELARVLPASDPLLVEVRQLWSCSNQDVYSMARSVCSVAQQLQSRGSVPRGILSTQWRGNMMVALHNAADDAVHACALPLSQMLRTLPAQCTSVDASACARALTMLAAKLKSLASALEQSSFEPTSGAGACYCRYDSWQRSLCTYFSDANLGAQCVAAVYLYTIEKPPLYNMLNKALRENDTKTLAALKPLYDHLQEFLKAMPCRPLVVCRGQKYQIIEMLSQQRRFASPMFTSTTIDPVIAYGHFLEGGACPGTFLVYILSRAAYIAPFSDFPKEKEVLAPPGVQFRVLYRVPLGHLAILDQKFDVAMLQDCAASSHYLTPEARVNASLEGSRCVTWTYRTVQRCFVEPLVQQTQPQAESPVPLFDAVRGLLREDSPNTWMLLVGDAGMGKSSCGIQINSRVSAPQPTEAPFGYDCVLISLPSVGKAVFDVGAIEQHVFERLGLEADTAAQAHMRRHSRLLVVLDSLDEVRLAQWPVNANLVDSFGRDRWAHLRVIVTCRGEHMRQHKLDGLALTGGRGSVWSLLSFEENHVQAFLRQATSNDGVRSHIIASYRALPPPHQTPFMLYLLVKGHKEFGPVAGGALPDVFDVYMRGVRALIRSNIHHSHIVGWDAAELEEEALQWSVRLAVVMLHRGVWQSTLSELRCDVLTDSFSCPFQLSPDRMLLLAPLRLKDYGWDSPFDFRHKSIHEFLVATAKLGMRQTCEDSELDFMVVQLDVTAHPNIKNFVAMGQPRTVPTTAIQPRHIRASKHTQHPSTAHVSQFTMKLQSISISAGTADDSTITQIVTNLPSTNNVRYMDASENRSVTDTSIALISQHCPNVHHLDVSRTSGKVSDTSIALIAQNCPNLRYLDVSKTEGRVSDKSIALIAQHCQNLQHLNVSWTKGIVSDTSIALLAKHCLNLRHLDVSWTDGEVSDASVALIAQHCLNLQHLNIRGSAGKVSDTSIALIAQHCLNLQHLNVSWTKGAVSDTSIARIAQHCTNLQHLDVSGSAGKVSDTSIALIAQHCLNLQHLDVSCARGKVSDTSIALIAQRCPNLHHLDVRDTDGKVSDTSIALIANYCSNLQHLDVSWTAGEVSDTSIALIAQHCQNLQYLKVGVTKGKVSDTSIALIAQLCPNLQCLDVDGTDGKVSDASIALIAQHCTNLQHLDVSKTEGRVSDTSIALIAQHCLNLHYLDVSGTSGEVSDTSIALIAQHCPSLQHLDIRDTEGKVSETSIALITQHCPSCRVIR